jgi:sugar lactone lactonase YvrE
MNIFSKSDLRAYLIILISLLIGSGCSKSGTTPTPTPVSPTKTTTPTVVVTSLNVNSGPYNTSVIITGSGFSSNGAEDQVLFNGKAATVIAATSTQLTASVPLGAGTGNVSVSVNGGAVSLGPIFTYQLAEIVTTIAGNANAGSENGAGMLASFYEPDGIAIDVAGNVYVADQYNNLIRKITPQGLVSTLAGSGNANYVDGTGTGASFNHPTGVAVDITGNVYVADSRNNRIRKITPAGVVSTLAGSGIINRNDGTGISASFNNPTGVAVDGAGNLFVADSSNGLIRKITADGVVSTFAGGPHMGFGDGTGTNAFFVLPYAIAIDKSGNLYVTDIQNSSIRVITSSAVVTTIAGGVQGMANGIGIAARFNEPFGIVPDNNGNIYIGDTFNSLIRKIDLNGVVTTFAGINIGFADGPLATAAFTGPEGLAMDVNGNLYVADAATRIRKITFQ